MAKIDRKLMYSAIHYAKEALTNLESCKAALVTADPDRLLLDMHIKAIKKMIALFDVKTDTKSRMRNLESTNLTLERRNEDLASGRMM